MAKTVQKASQGETTMIGRRALRMSEMAKREAVVNIAPGVPAAAALNQGVGEEGKGSQGAIVVAVVSAAATVIAEVGPGAAAGGAKADAVQKKTNIMDGTGDGDVAIATAVAAE